MGSNGSHHNGKGNGRDKKEDEKRIIRFPSQSEREDSRKKQEKEWRKQYKKERKAQDEPFFNAGKIPLLTRIIIGLFLAVHIPLYLFFDAADRMEVFSTLGFVPAYYTGAIEWSWVALLGPFTHIFIHGGWMHLLFNAVMMLAMGMFTETAFGFRRMLIFFVVSGLSGALFYFLISFSSTNPVVGASGSISGLFGVTFLLLHEKGMLGQIGRRGPMPLIIFWIVLITGMGLLGGDIAWQAHLGGFLGGIGLLTAMKKGWVRL